MSPVAAATTTTSSPSAGKQPLLKSKYFQPPPTRSSLAADPDPEDSGESSTNASKSNRDSIASGSNDGRISPTAAAIESLPTSVPARTDSFGSRTEIQTPGSAPLLSNKKHTSALIDTAKWGVRYNNRQAQGHTPNAASMSPLPPGVQDLRDSNGRSSSLTLQPPSRPDTGRKASEGGVTLRPLAYSPEPTSEDDREDREEDEAFRESRSSWRHGDQGASKREPPPKEEKLQGPQLQMPQLPPKLPLLYFEQDHSIGQIDFAYQQPRPTSQHSLSEASQTSEGDEQVTPVPDTNGLSVPRRPSPRPSPPPIDTSIPYKGSKRVERETKGTKTPPQQSDKDAEGGSFYWGSPRSSAEDSGQSPKPFEESRKDETPKKSEINTGDSSLVSASALGFGGPSDWEHFGDYDAEEVDDIDLYTSNRPRTAELPTESTPLDDVPQDSGLLGPEDISSISPGRLLGERKILSTIEERASENLEDVFVDRRIENQQGEQIDADAVFHAHPPPPPPKGQLEGRDSPDDRRDSKPDDLRSSNASTSTETINRISFEVPPPPDSARSETSSRKSRPLEDIRESIGSPRASKVATPGSISISSESTTEVTKPSEDTKAQKPENRELTRVMNEATREATDGVKTGRSSVLSPTSDDGKEDIIISLQVPDSPAAPNEPAPLDMDKVKLRRTSGQAVQEEPQKSPDLLRSGRRSIYPGSIELENPYEGLEAWGKASLNRYVKMLREEAKAVEDEDKYMTFFNFMQKELRTRAVFYDMDDESDLSDYPVMRAPSKKKHPRKDASTPPPLPQSGPLPSPSAGIRTSKALPALPVDTERIPVHSPPLQEELNLPNVPRKDPPLPLQGSNGSSTEQSELTPPGTGLTSSRSKPDISMHNAEKPMAATADEQTQDGSSLRGAPSLNALRRAVEIVATRKSTITPSDSQTIAQSTGQPDRTEFNTQQQPTQDTGTTNGDVQSEEQASSDDPQDKALNHNEGKPYEGDKAANRQSIYQPFSAMLRQSSIRSGSSGARGSQNLGNTSSFVGSDGKLTPHSSRNPKTSKPGHYRYTVLEPLIAVVPQGPVVRQEPEQLVRVRQGMEAIPDDFTFIHKTVLAWDADAKKARERYEQERHARHSQNDQRLDELFNEQEIGYSDISRLEDDFKRSEAAKKADEDREEVNTFVASVFDVVWARINYEMDRLSPLYDECTRLVSAASAGRGMFEEDTTTAVPIAPAMEALLNLYQKLMVRHQKAFEAVLERDRRLKKVEVAPWYALGAVDKVKRIEKRFEDAEKKAILEFCRHRDERANLLMDVLDQNTLRGVGANQDYMESVMQAVRKICESLATPSAVEENDMVSADEVLKAKAITTALARSSEQIVQTFHVADMLLNGADYEVSVANAKLNGADAAAFRRLRDAKSKEDSKLALDLEHRMGLIRGDTARTHDEINKLLMLIEERQGGPGSAKAGEDPEKEERFREALEDARRRAAGTAL